MSQNHKDIFKLLFPIPIEGVFDDDIAIEGQYLDDVKISAMNLLLEMFPDTATLMLADWERVYGLPDPCTGALTSLQARRAALLDRYRGKSSQNMSFYIALAESLGFTVTIDEAQGTAGTDDWAFKWYVNAPETTITYFRAGQSTAGEPLASWGNTLLECAFNRRKQAHTEIVFTYGGQ